MVLRRIGKDQLLVPVSGSIARTNAVFPLNVTGAFIWERVSAGQTVEEVAKALAGEFNVSIDQAIQDASSFIDLLLHEKLLEATPA